jgi:hypothetical protein
MFALLASALVVLLVWAGPRLAGGPTGQEAALLAAAKFLEVDPEDLAPSLLGSPERGYAFHLKKDDGKRQATVWVNREPIYVRWGVFYVESEEGEAILTRSDGVKAATRFARQRLPDFGKPGQPSSVWQFSDRGRPRWSVTWEVFDKEPPRFLAVAIDAVGGQVTGFEYRKEAGAPLGRIVAKVTRQAAIEAGVRAAKAEPPGDWEIEEATARLGRTWKHKPLGYPVWEVDTRATRPLRRGARIVWVGCAHAYIIDAVTGQLLPQPTVGLGGKPAAVLAAVKSVRAGLSEGWGRMTVVSAERDTTGKWGPPGRPIWEVRVRCEKRGDEEPRPAKIYVRLVDGITGEIIQAPESNASEADAASTGGVHKRHEKAPPKDEPR